MKNITRDTFCRSGFHTTGMTPLDGWIICKFCGEDLFKVKGEPTLIKFEDEDIK